MFGVTAILALSCGAATSQTVRSSQVLNNQLQLGELIAGETLNVVDQSGGVTAVTTATGNAMTAAASVGRNMNVTSEQEMQGSAAAHGVVNAYGAFGSAITMTTAATGNTGDASINRAVLTSNVTQVAGQVEFSAIGQLEGEDAVTADATVNTQAVANSQSFALTNSSVGARVTQSSEADVVAIGGAALGGTSGSALVTANAAGNNVDSVGEQQSAQRLVVNQTNAGERVQASKYTTYGDSYVTNTNAMAQGNNVSATNEGPLLDLTTNQTNGAYVRSEAQSSSASYSSSTVTAYGTGNSTVAGNIGPEIVLDNTQYNTGGGVEVIADSDQGAGWDSVASATAVGNAATGYACSSCTGRMTVTNNQTNDVGVTATSTSLSQYGRSVTGIASATGNSASFYVSAPAASSTSQ
jgi:hypothetical protein